MKTFDIDAQQNDDLKKVYERLPKKIEGGDVLEINGAPRGIFYKHSLDCAYFLMIPQNTTQLFLRRFRKNSFFEVAIREGDEDFGPCQELLRNYCERLDQGE